MYNGTHIFADVVALFMGMMSRAALAECVLYEIKHVYRSDRVAIFLIGYEKKRLMAIEKLMQCAHALHLWYIYHSYEKISLHGS